MSDFRRVIVIGLAGAAQSGKSTAAREFVRGRGKDDKPFDFRAISLAWPIKEAVGRLFGFAPGQMELSGLKEEIDSRWNNSPRRLMQLIATFSREEGHDYIFCYHVAKFISACIEAPHKAVTLAGTDVAHRFVIADVRFPTEAAWVWRVGGRIIRTVRDDIPEEIALKSDETAQHASETSLELFKPDYTIQAGGPIEEYRKRVRVFVEEKLPIWEEEAFLWEQDNDYVFHPPIEEIK